MSDGVFIPGISSKYNSGDAINKIMESKREKLTQMDENKVALAEKRTAWTEINSKAVSVKAKAAQLYGIKAPFDEKVTQSTNEYAFSGKAIRAAQIGEYKINIIQKATAHRISSDTFPIDYKLQAGTYKFSIGSEEISIPFQGGTVDSLVEAISKHGKNSIKASVTMVSKDTRVLSIESGRTGEGAKISFKDPFTAEIFESMNFFKPVNSFEKSIPIGKASVKGIIPSDEMLVDNSVKLNPVTELIVETGELIRNQGKLMLEFSIKSEVIPEDKLAEFSTPTGPNFKKQGDIELFDTKIEGESVVLDIPGFVMPEKVVKVIVDDDRILDIVTDKRTISIPELDISETYSKKTIDLSEFLNTDEKIKSIGLKNNNTNKIVTIGEMKIYDNESKDGVKYTNELSKARNSVIILDGIKVERESNIIDDLIKGVTLNVYEKTDREETLKIDRDYNLIIEKITEFLGEYNQLISDIRGKTATESTSDDKKGLFAGDQALNSLVSRMRSILMNPYSTSYGSELSMLSQAGISTNATGAFGMDVDKIHRGGVLEVNEDKFIESMQKYPDGIKQIFGNDTTGDMIINDGVAYQLDVLLGAYTTKGTGYFDNRKNTVELQIKDQEKKKTTYESKLKDEEKKLKQDFMKMEKASQELDESSKKFQNMFKQ